MRAIHPQKYTFRSDKSRRESLLRAAFLSPEMFETGVVRAHVFPVRPTARGSWEGLLAISFPVALGETAGRSTAREFGAVLHDGPRVAHRFNRRIELQPESAEVTSAPMVTFLEPVELKPGSYVLSVVMANPEDPDPHATKIVIDLPEVPKRELFLVGPILGRPSGSDLVVTGGGMAGGLRDSMGDANSFQPLLVQQLDDPVDLVALTEACYVAKKSYKRKKNAPTVVRSLQGSDGSVIGELQPVELALESDDRVHCQNLVDVLPARALGNGEYVFEAMLDPGRDKEGPRERVRFAVGPARGLRGLSPKGTVP